MLFKRSSYLKEHEQKLNIQAKQQINNWAICVNNFI